jgi:uncharacterized membrane protein YeaQ/YmgE (transglycosylase-associated protein family)
MTDAAALTALVPLILQAAAGAVGGNITGMIRRTESWGPLLNSALGAIGGVGAAQALNATGQSEQAAAWAGGNLAAVETGLAVAAGTLLSLMSSAFKQPD